MPLCKLRLTVFGPSHIVPLIDFRELRAMPEGIVEWGLIVLFWVVLAFFLSLTADAIPAQSQENPDNPNFTPS